MVAGEDMTINLGLWLPLALLTQPQEELDQAQADRQEDGKRRVEHTTHLEPNQGGSINGKPKRLPDDDPGRGRRCAWEAAVKERRDWQYCPGDCQNTEEEEQPSWSYGWQGGDG